MVLIPARAAGEQPGVLWESTSQTVMEGVPIQMPAQTMKFCAAREWKQPPAGGEITFSGADSYSGQIKFTSDEMKMTIKLTGRKIGGCDNPR